MPGTYISPAETGFYYLQSRYYDPAIGRFLNADSPDLIGINPTQFTDKNLYAYCDNNPVVRIDDGGEFWNLVIGGVVGGIIGGITSAISTYKETGSVSVASTLLGVACGAIGGVIGASGIPALGQAAASAMLNATNNIGNCLISNEKIDWVDVGIDATIGAVSSGIGSAVTSKASSAANKTIAKGIRRVVSGKNKYDSGSRYWKGGIKRGLSIVSDGVKSLNTAQGYASVIGSGTGGIFSVTKTIIKTRRGTM